MHALIMAGGSGRRMGGVEKPLVLIRSRPMIAYVIDAFLSAGCYPVVAVSPRTPMTANWCRANGIPVVRTGGTGYIGDMIDAVRTIDEPDPLFISVADIPCIPPAVIHTIAGRYHASGRDGCSAWVPARLVREEKDGVPYRETVDGAEACPAGVNILNGARIGEPQDEVRILIDEPGLALNVNTRRDLQAAEVLLARKERRPAY